MKKSAAALLALSLAVASAYDGGCPWDASSAMYAALSGSGFVPNAEYCGSHRANALVRECQPSKCINVDGSNNGIGASDSSGPYERCDDTIFDECGMRIYADPAHCGYNTDGTLSYCVDGRLEVKAEGLEGSQVIVLPSSNAGNLGVTTDTTDCSELPLLTWQVNPGCTIAWVAEVPNQHELGEACTLACGISTEGTSCLEGAYDEHCNFLYNDADGVDQVTTTDPNAICEALGISTEGEDNDDGCDVDAIVTCLSSNGWSGVGDDDDDDGGDFLAKYASCTSEIHPDYCDCSGWINSVVPSVSRALGDLCHDSIGAYLMCDNPALCSSGCQSPPGPAPAPTPAPAPVPATIEGSLTVQGITVADAEANAAVFQAAIAALAGVEASDVVVSFAAAAARRRLSDGVVVTYEISVASAAAATTATASLEANNSPAAVQVAIADAAVATGAPTETFSAVTVTEVGEPMTTEESAGVVDAADRFRRFGLVGLFALGLVGASL